MEAVEFFNRVIMVAFLICYSYQFFYIAVSLFFKKREHKKEEAPIHKFAVLVAARNEECVVGNLIDSLTAQDYPKEAYDIILCADNCTDRTAEVARAHGAEVYEKTTPSHGKGDVLRYLTESFREEGRHYDAFVVFDADNIVNPDFLTEINKTYSDGCEIVTCYRNSKNYGDNWLSAGIGLWFLREAKYLNEARFKLGSSCAISGTGFLFSEKILNELGGWNCSCLTEDIEFTITNVVRGTRIGYCREAEIYDEQPVKFSQSWRQRVRWTKGYLQVLKMLGGKMIAGIFRGSWSCYDMTMNIAPAAVLTGLCACVNVAAAVWTFVVNAGSVVTLLWSLFSVTVGLYLTAFVVGTITTLSEWKSINCSNVKKLLYMFTFPLFMFTFIPICITAFFARAQWKPIEHKRVLNLKDIENSAAK